MPRFFLITRSEFKKYRDSSKNSARTCVPSKQIFRKIKKLKKSGQQPNRDLNRAGFKKTVTFKIPVRSNTV